MRRISPSPRSARDLREAAHLRDRDLADREHDADPVQPGLLLRAHADMRGAIEGRARLHGFGRRARQLPAQLLLDGGEEFLEAPGVEHVFQPRLVAVGAVAMLDEHAHHRVGDFRRVLRLHDHAGVAREIAVAGDAAEREAEPDARLDAVPVDHLDGLEADVVGVLQHRNDAAAVEADIELARQAVERAIVQDVEVPFARVGPRVDQLLRVDAGGRRAGDVADVVGAGAARPQAEALDAFDHLDRVLRLDLADLQVRARRHMRVRPAAALGEIGDAGELPVLQDAVRNAQPAHVGVLRGRDVEQPVIAPAEIVGGLRRLVLLRLLLQPVVGIERMLLALELLLIGELAARRRRRGPAP